MRDLARVDVSKQLVYDAPTNAVDFLKFYTAILSNVPDEYKSVTRIDFNSVREYGDEVKYIEMYYYRPKTEEEIQLESAAKKASAMNRKKQLLEQLQKINAQLGEIGD